MYICLCCSQYRHIFPLYKLDTSITQTGLKPVKEPHNFNHQKIFLSSLELLQDSLNSHAIHNRTRECIEAKWRMSNSGIFKEKGCRELIPINIIYLPPDIVFLCTHIGIVFPWRSPSPKVVESIIICLQLCMAPTASLSQLQSSCEVRNIYCWAYQWRKSGCDF